MLARQDIELLDDLPAGRVINHLELRDETIQLGFRNTLSKRLQRLIPRESVFHGSVFRKVHLLIDTTLTINSR